MKLCLNCNKEIISKDNRKKFCNSSCSATFGNKLRGPTTDAQKERISLSLKRYYDNNPATQAKRAAQSEAVGKSTKGKYHKQCPDSLLSLSKRTVSKILGRMNLPCSRCGWKEGTLDIHHIVPKKSGGNNSHSNLSALCPNCHRSCHCKKINPNELITLESYIKDNWKSFYFG